MDKINKSYRLSQEAIEYIDLVSLSFNINRTQALEKIIEEHKDSRQLSSSEQQLATAIVSEIESKYKNTFTRIRLAAGQADKSALILLEMMNTLLISLGKEQHAYTSRISKSAAWEQCEQEVTRRISHFKQQKDSKKK